MAATPSATLTAARPRPARLAASARAAGSVTENARPRHGATHATMARHISSVEPSPQTTKRGGTFLSSGSVL